MTVTTSFFPGGKRKALTMSYDDGKIYDRRLIEIFNRYGIKGSFHLNSGRIGKESYVEAKEIEKLYEGHEVSLHTYSHPTSSHTPREQLIFEIMKDRELLEKYSGQIVRGLSYPNGSFDKKVAELFKSLGVVYGRTTVHTDGYELPEDYMFWNPTMHHTRGLVKWNPDLKPDREVLMNKAKDFANLWTGPKNMPVLYVWGHSYEFNDDDTWEVMEQFCEYIGRQNDIWFATNIEIYDYMQAVERLEFSAECTMVHNPSAISVWIDVDDKSVEVKSGETLRLDI